MHELEVEYIDEIREFYNEACRRHEKNLMGYTVEIGFVNLIGATLSVKTSEGDVFSVTEEDKEPTITFANTKEKINLRLGVARARVEEYEVEVTKEGEEYIALGGRFHSLDGVEAYIQYMISSGLDPEDDPNMRFIKDSESIKFKGLKRLK